MFAPSASAYAGKSEMLHYIVRSRGIKIFFRRPIMAKYPLGFPDIKYRNKHNTEKGMKNRRTLQLILREIIYLLCLLVFVYKAIMIFLHYSDVRFACVQGIGYAVGAVLIFTFAVANLVIYLRRRGRDTVNDPQLQEREHAS